MSGTTGGKVEIDAKKKLRHQGEGGMQSQNATGTVR